MSLVIKGSSSGQVTVDVPAAAGTNTLTLPTNTATVGIVGPAFRAYQSSAQTLANTTFTKISFDTEVFDTASCYDNTSNYRFTPNVAGYYYIKGMVRFAGTSDGKVLVARIYKNGSNDTSFEGSSSASQSSTQTSTILHMNGSSDYVEFYSYHNYGSNTDTAVFGSATVIFQGYLVSAT